MQGVCRCYEYVALSESAESSGSVGRDAVLKMLMCSKKICQKISKIVVAVAYREGHTLLQQVGRRRKISFYDISGSHGRTSCGRERSRYYEF